MARIYKQVKSKQNPRLDQDWPRYTKIGLDRIRLTQIDQSIQKQQKYTKLLYQKSQGASKQTKVYQNRPTYIFQNRPKYVRFQSIPKQTKVYQNRTKYTKVYQNWPKHTIIGKVGPK